MKDQRNMHFEGALAGSAMTRKGFLTAASVAGIAGVAGLGAAVAQADTGTGSPLGEAVECSAAFNQAQDDLRSRMRDFVQQVCYPRKDELLASGNAFIPQDIYAALAQTGAFGVLMSEPDSEARQGVTGGCIVAEELAKVSPTLGLIAADVAVQALAVNACPAASGRFLAGILAGETVVAGASFAPEGVQDVSVWPVVGVRDGSDWVLNGSSGHVALNDAADVRVLYGLDDQGDLRIWFVEGDAEGLSCGESDDRCGMRGLGGSSLTLEDVSVSDELSITALDAGLAGQAYGLYAMVAAVALGTVGGAYAFAQSWARSRTHDFEPLLKYQKQRHKLARVATKVAVMRAALYNAAAMLDAGQDDGRMLAQMCKAYIPAECIPAVHELNILLAGWGYHHVEWFHYYQDVLGTAVMDVPTDYQYEALTDLLGLTEY